MINPGQDVQGQNVTYGYYVYTVDVIHRHGKRILIITPRKTNIDTKNDGLEDVSPFKHAYFW